MKRVCWPPAWWTTVSTSWRSASVELYPAPASTACVPWSTMLTLCWSLTSGAHSLTSQFTFENNLHMLFICSHLSHVCVCVTRSCPRLSERCCITSCGRASPRRRFRIFSVASAVRSVWCRAAYSRASSTRWALRVLRMPRLHFWWDGNTRTCTHMPTSLSGRDNYAALLHAVGQTMTKMKPKF